MTAERSTINRALLILLIVIGAGSLVMAVTIYFSLPRSPEKQIVSDAKGLAGELADNNLHQAAIEEYKKILNAFPLDQSERGAINYLIAEIYFEDIGDYEKAAAYYIRARALDEGASYYTEAGKNLITSLERLGRRLDARRELDRQTSLEPDTAMQKAGKIVAKIGSSEISLADFNEALESLPPEARSKYSDSAGKKEFLNQLIGRELIYRAALREGYDKEVRVRKDLKELEKDYLVQYYTQGKILPTVKPDTAGLNLYYEAHKEDYDNRPMDEIGQQVTQDYINYLTQNAVRDYIDRLLEAEPVQMFEENLR